LSTPAGTGAFDGALEAIFGPSPALSAFARLGADLIVAHQLYPQVFNPALFAYGTVTGTGKTALAEFLVRALGLEREEAIVQMGHKAPGEIVGRRGAGQRFESVEHLGYPFVCLDELGEAEPEVRRRAQAICHGESVVVIEGEHVQIRATVMATWNPRKGATVLGLPYLRRAVVLCADAPGVAIPDLPRRLRDADLARTGAGTLRPGELRPVAPGLEDDVISLLEQCSNVLTDEGRARHDTRILELATLGRAARQRRAPDELAPVAYFVATDLLIVTETVPGLVVDGWDVELEKAVACWGDVPGMAELAALAARRAQLRERAHSEVVVRRQRGERADLELAGERARLRAELEEAAKVITQVPPAHRAVAAGIRAKLRSLRVAAGEARSAGRLAEVSALAHPVIVQASQLRGELDADRLRRDQSLAEQAAQRRSERARLAAVRAGERVALKERDEALRRDRAARSELLRLRSRSTTKSGEDVAARLVAVGVVRREVEYFLEEVPPFPGAGLFARVRGKPAPEPQFRELSRTIYIDRARHRYAPDELAAWGDVPVLQAIDATVDALDESGAMPVPPGRVPSLSQSVLELLPGPALEQ